MRKSDMFEKFSHFYNPWKPTLDTEFGGKNPFFLENPADIFDAGKQHQVKLCSQRQYSKSRLIGASVNRLNLNNWRIS